MNGNGSVALETQKEECKSAIIDIKDAAQRMKDAVPGSECPVPAFPKAVASFNEAMARGQIALLRSRVAEIELTQHDMEDARTMQVQVRATLKKKLVAAAVALRDLANDLYDQEAAAVKESETAATGDETIKTSE